LEARCFIIQPVTSSTSTDICQFTPAQTVQGVIRVPGDKSITHRAILFGLLAHGITTVDDWLDAGDCRSSLRVAQQLGAKVEELGNQLTITGTGGMLQEPLDILDCGNSGTTIRLFLGALAGRIPFVCMTGDASLRKRPMQRVTDPLRLMGANIFATKDKYLPLCVRGQSLNSIEYALPVASAQVKSAVLLAGMSASQGVTTVIEREISRNHTEMMLQAFGAPLEIEIKSGVRHLSIQAGGVLKGTHVVVPGDISSAAFIMATAAILPESSVTIQNVGLNPTRTGILGVMERMGCQLNITNRKVVAGESSGDITVKYSTMRATNIGGSEIPTLIDELPILAILAAYADGVTRVTGAEELRVKETDRIQAIVTGLRAIGVAAEDTSDGFYIHGGQTVRGGTVNSFHDHRIAMSFAVAGLASEKGVAVENWSCVDISYPTFANVLSSLTI